MTAVPCSRRHAARTVRPSGAVTAECRVAPPKTSSNPSPPSDNATAWASAPSACAARTTASPAANEVAVPLNSSRAASTRTLVGQLVVVAAAARRSASSTTRTAGVGSLRERR